MSKLPRISGKEAIRAFERAGFVVVRSQSSHFILKKEGHPVLLSIPKHRNKNLGLGILTRLIRDAGLTTDEFAAYAKGKRP